VPRKETYAQRPEHYAAKAREWRQNNPERARFFDRQKHMRKRLARFGLTAEDADRIKSEQGNACAICHKPEIIKRAEDSKTRELSFDHCHTSGKFRGFLCGSCNQGLGYFFDEPQALRAAADYLERS
jgi:nitrate/TMAO reductase-like tetraheme cytochrome c subunit